MNAKQAKKLRKLTKAIVEIAEDVNKEKVELKIYKTMPNGCVVLDESSRQGAYKAAKKEMRQK